MAHELLGFRNNLSCGTWKEEQAWLIPNGDSDVLRVGPLEQGRCPVVGTKIAWGGLLIANLLQGPWWAKLERGYLSWTGLLSLNYNQAIRICCGPCVIRTGDCHVPTTSGDLL